MKYSQTLKSRSIRINYYQFVRSCVFSCRFIGIKRFRLVWFINFFNQHQTSLKQFKNNRNLSLPFTRAFNLPQLINAKKSSDNYFQQLLHFNQKRLQHSSIRKPLPPQHKPIAIQKVDPNKTRSNFTLTFSISCSFLLSYCSKIVTLKRFHYFLQQKYC